MNYTAEFQPSSISRRFRDGISGPDRHELRPRDDHHRDSVLGLTFETLKTLISGLAGFVPKPTGCETSEPWADIEGGSKNLFVAAVLAQQFHEIVAALKRHVQRRLAPVVDRIDVSFVGD